MLLFLIISLLGLKIVHPAAVILPLDFNHAAQLSPPQNVTTAVNFLPGLNSSLPTNFIDPRFTAEVIYGNQRLNKKSAYMNTLLALADLSTKGWTRILRYDAQYELSRVGDVTIRIYASQNPSSLQFRHAIWGLYLAIRETSANDFRDCLLGLYWSPVVGRTRHHLGYVSILTRSSPGIGGDNFTERSLQPAPSTQVSPQEPAISNFTTILNNSASLITQAKYSTNLKVQFNLIGRPLDIDGVFHAVYTGLVSQSSYPQRDAIDKPGVVDDPITRTILRWDCTHLTAHPTFEYRYAIAALAGLPAYMYMQNRFEETRYIVFVDDAEVGRGWVYGGVLEDS